MTPEGLVRHLLREHPGRVAVLSSFGAEAAVLLHLVAGIDRAMPVLFLETGKHFPETLAYRAALASRLGLRDVRDLLPDPALLAGLDPDGTLWSRAPDQCCALRKVFPLDAALEGFDVLLDGRKRHHGAERTALQAVRQEDGKLRVSPLALWDSVHIAAYRAEHDLPDHPLFARGYASIGCAPCTSPTRPGEPPRAGRWRGTGKTECGIHHTPSRNDNNKALT
ncbi:phosphoadenylyl-sulfate reductase [Rhodovarius crocodyli]|uniref:Adenosine 5'-phosphosulfate reductase n=1 Tax=Rhodovarius crocodyli TaxID=1979269 RepID=A0A437M1T4_9PROT|nr:phosphoadenylyl-sulfate reductase [Rhodovarius crocodyli]RVT91648.1 phosphoadenylyl-sulfate reductase [Rhodovarius crocodyli]